MWGPNKKSDSYIYLICIVNTDSQKTILVTPLSPSPFPSLSSYYYFPSTVAGASGHSEQRRQGPVLTRLTVQCGGQGEAAQGSARKRKKRQGRSKVKRQNHQNLHLCVSLSGWAYNSALCRFSGLTWILDTQGQSPSIIFYPLTQIAQFANWGNQTPNVTAPTADSFLSPDQIPKYSEKSWKQQTDGNSTLYIFTSYKTSALWQS